MNTHAGSEDFVYSPNGPSTRAITIVVSQIAVKKRVEKLKCFMILVR